MTTPDSMRPQQKEAEEPKEIDINQEIEKLKKRGAVVSPMEILERKIVRPVEDFPEIVTDLDDPECQIQQNGLDLRLADAAIAVGHTKFTLDKNYEERCNYSPVAMDQEGCFTFAAGRMYAIDFMEWVQVPTDMCAYVFVRSSMNRYSGSFITGLWDSGFRGRLGGVFRPQIHTAIEQGVRMAQIVFLRAEPYRLYEGQYQDQKKQV